jgi:hypothetical protein
MNTVSPVSRVRPVKQPSSRGRARRSVPVAVAAVSAAALLLAGCDTDGTGVEDAGSHHDDGHTDTAMSGDLTTQAAPEPTHGSPQPTLDAPTTPAPVGSDPEQITATEVPYGNFLVPLGADASPDSQLTCSFNEDPAAAGFAWACEAPVHLGWTATDGGEANSVAYRPGAEPEIYALLGNSGVTASQALGAGLSVSVGDRYTVDTTGAGAVVTDNSTGVAVQMADGGYTQL